MKRKEVEIGRVFDRLTVTDSLGIEGRYTMVKCSCMCGGLKVTSYQHLLNKDVKSCGCLMRREYEVIGMIKNGIECISDVFKVDKKETITIKCHCGNVCNRLFDSFRKGHMKSCGCEIKRHDINVGDKHGRLTITNIKPNNKGGNRIVEAECECGSVKEYQYVSIINKEDRGCGCGYYVSHDLNAFSSIGDDEMYWAGFLAADGCIHKKAISIQLAIRDEQHVLDFKKFMKSEHKLLYVAAGDRKGDGAVVLAIKNQSIVDNLKAFGIGERKSLTYSPTPICQNKHFWRGMFDGDGWIRKDRNEIGLVGTYDTLKSFLDWCEAELGVTGINIHKKDKIFSLATKGKLAKIIALGLYGDNPKYKLKRKHDLFIKHFSDGIVN